MNTLYDSILTPSLSTVMWGDPLVSFLIPTYGRAATQPDLMNEVVWWACNQNYPNIEVLILNDAPHQRVWINQHTWPQVRIVNLPERLPTMGHKRDLLNLLAAGTICCPNDDDDISLPNRAGQAVQMTQDFEWWSPRLWLYNMKGTPSCIDGNGYGYTSSAFRRQSMLGRHPKVNKGDDAKAAEYANKNLRCNPIGLPNLNGVNYVYRWGVSPNHFSGHPDMDTTYANNSAGPHGAFEIVPARGPTDWEAERALAVQLGVRPKRS